MDITCKKTKILVKLTKLENRHNSISQTPLCALTIGRRTFAHGILKIHGLFCREKYLVANSGGQKSGVSKNYICGKDCHGGRAVKGVTRDERGGHHNAHIHKEHIKLQSQRTQLFWKQAQRTQHRNKEHTIMAQRTHLKSHKEHS